MRELIDYLSAFISPERRQKFDAVLKHRTRYITVVLEDIYQSHNASAVLRSCDCFGIQDVHIIENKNKYKVSEDVAMGSQKWLNLYRYNKEGQDNTRDCLQTLRDQGYSIVATSPHETSLHIEDLPLDQPIALCMGTEITGITENIKSVADRMVKIPMFGFTESFNISVSTALCLYSLTNRLHSSSVSFQLTDKEKEVLLHNWIKQTINKGELIEKEYFKMKGKENS